MEIKKVIESMESYLSSKEADLNNIRENEKPCRYTGDLLDEQEANHVDKASVNSITKDNTLEAPVNNYEEALEPAKAKITLDNGQTIETDVEGSDEEIKKDFENKEIEVGNGGVSRKAKVKSIEVTRTVAESNKALPRAHKIDELDTANMGADPILPIKDVVKSGKALKVKRTRKDK